MTEKKRKTFTAAFKANGFACGLLALALLVLPPAVEPMHAADSALLEIIEILYSKGSIDEQEYQLLLRAAREESVAAVAETDQEKIAEEVSRQVEEATALLRADRQDLGLGESNRLE